MKKLIAIIAILALVTTVFATESDPSETVGFVKYSCINNPDPNVTSNNFIANAMDAGYSTAQDLGNAIGTDYCTAVNKWDAAAQGWTGISWNPLFSAWSGNFDLESGNAYMINVIADVDVYIAGDLPSDPQFNLLNNPEPDVTSNNFIMLPLSMSDLNTAQELGNDMGTDYCTAVNNWDAAAQGWTGISWNPLFGAWSGNFDIDTGQPLMVNIISDITWPSSDGEKIVKPISSDKGLNQSKKAKIKAIRR